MTKKVVLTWDDMYKIKFRNTRCVREAAIMFEEKGKYCLYSEGDPLREMWYDEQERRSLYGDWFPIGPLGEMIYIPGYFYWYLNFCPILLLQENQHVEKASYQDQIVVDDEGAISYKDYKLIQSDRIEGFPRFWDGDHWHYKYIDEAERAAMFGVELKKRGVGASFKAASMATRNYFLIPRSNSFLIADDKDFLLGDGVLQKAWDMMNFIDKNTDFAKRRQYLNTQMAKRASFRETIDGVEVERGFMSSIIGKTTKNNPGGVRGIRGKLIYLEEAGKDPYLLEKFRILINSVKQGRKVFGYIHAAGTGGQSGADYEGLTTLFYNPEAFNIYPVKNIWSQNSEHKNSGFFWPVYMSYEGFIDSDGNSDMEAAKAFEMAERKKIIENSPSRATYLQHCSENPMTPEEATLNVTRNIFPVEELMAQLNEVETNPMKRNYALHGYLYRNESNVVAFRPDPNALPIDRYPWDKKNLSEDGCITIYDFPDKVNGIVPDNMYLLVNDPYYHDNSGTSLGATYIYKKINNINKYHMDMIVASYVGRPKTLDEYLRNMFMLAEFYNARISFEIDKGRSVLDYARRHKKLEWLQPEFEFKYNTQIPKSKVKRGYGFKMSSGPNDPVRKIGEQYLADWLIRERSVEDDGRVIMNLHLIYDIALLQELIRYDSKGNYDRVDAMIQLMYYIREVENIAPMFNKEEEYGSFFHPSRVARFYSHAKWY